MSFLDGTPRPRRTHLALTLAALLLSLPACQSGAATSTAGTAGATTTNPGNTGGAGGAGASTTAGGAANGGAGGDSTGGGTTSSTESTTSSTTASTTTESTSSSTITESTSSTASTTSTSTAPVGAGVELFAELPGPHVLRQDQAHLYVHSQDANGHRIVRIDKAGGAVSTLVDSTNAYITHDVNADTLFYSESGPDCAACPAGGGNVYSMPSAGGSPALLATLAPWSPAIVGVGQLGLYLVSWNEGELWRVPFLGGPPELVVASGVSNEASADESGGVYFLGASGLMRFDEATSTVAAMPAGTGSILRLRGKGDFAYWLTIGKPTTVRRAKLNGTVETLLSFPQPASQLTVTGSLVVTMPFAARGDVDFPFGEVMAASLLDGKVTSPATHVYQPGDVLADATHIYFVSYGGAGTPDAIWRVPVP